MQHQTSLFRGQPDNESIKIIQYYEQFAIESDPRGYCVCTSEGKDSRVLGHLMRRAGVKHFYLHSITGIDPPELVYFQRRNFAQYKADGYQAYDVMYSISFWQLCRKKRMLPMRNRRFCCEFLKEKLTPEQGNSIACMGVRKGESEGRNKKRNELEIVKGKNNIIMPFDNSENRQTFETCYRDRKRRINPIAYWTDEDIWNYSHDVNLEQCELYGQGFFRLGCIGCPMARQKGRENEYKRWPKFKELTIRTAQHIIDDRIADGLEPFKLASTGAEYFDWWISDGAQKFADENQIDLYEDEL